MAVLPLVIEPDARLHIPSKKVEAVDDTVRQLLSDMLETMYANDGIGLAAVQVGVHKRIVVVDIARRDGGYAPMKFINPEVVEKSSVVSTYNEGCLSLPEQFSEVTRPETVTVNYLDEHGAPQVLHADGLMATCIQHEIDHTNGIVFVDHISKLKRDMIVRKLKKAKKMGLFHDLPEAKAVL